MIDVCAYKYLYIYDHLNPCLYLHSIAKECIKLIIKTNIKVIQTVRFRSLGRAKSRATDV